MKDIYDIKCKSQSEESYDYQELKRLRKFFSELNINTGYIHELSYVTKFGIIELFNKIMELLIPLNDIEELSQKTKLSIKDILNSQDDETITSNILSKKSRIINLCLGLPLDHEQRLDLYSKAANVNFYNYTKQITKLPIEPGERKVKRMVEARMYIFALLNPKYFPSLSDWNSAFQFCLDEHPLLKNYTG